MIPLSFTAIALMILGATAVHSSAPLSWEIGPFSRPTDPSINPVISPDSTTSFNCPMRGQPVRWEAGHTFNPAAAIRDGKVWLLYRAEDTSGIEKIGAHTSRLGLAVSDDGLHFTRRPEPVFFPTDDEQKGAEWDGGCEDPRLIATPDGTFVLTYTQWNHKQARLAVATSPDLQHWTKHGCAFGADTLYARGNSKSAAILGKPSDADGQLVATKVNGKYWMYWGDSDVRLAFSDDLIHWSVLETSPGQALLVLPKRRDHFDSALAEGGPPAVWTEQGIVVIYNGKNATDHGDSSLPTGTYAVGQALFDKADPTKLLSRPEQPFYEPETAFERTGQYAAGTTFAEGLVRFKGKWFLYYGCADSFVAVAVTP
jgi:predicted GH43/DUF377 family glycosyl hydrolase